MEGLKRPGLDEGVLAAVFAVVVAGSIVEVQQGESRHVWATAPGKAFGGSASSRHCSSRDNGPGVREDVVVGVLVLRADEGEVEDQWEWNR